MICSMTAYSRKEARTELGELIWELRSVNHRYLELSIRLPEELRRLEPKVREALNNRLGRGKVECTLRFQAGIGSGAGIRVNRLLAEQLMKASAEVDAIVGSSVRPQSWDILRWPGVLELEKQDFAPLEEQAARLLEEAVSDLIEVRQREGGFMYAAVEQRCATMRDLVERA